MDLSIVSKASRKAYFIFGLVIFLFTSSRAQEFSANPKLLNGGWNAHWITRPGVPAKAYGVCHSRKFFDLNEDVLKFIIHVSADNRYILYVNEAEVSKGPASRYIIKINLFLNLSSSAGALNIFLPACHKIS